MKNTKFKLTALVLTTFAMVNTVNFASAHGGPELHINPRWKECSFQLDPSLTQNAWHQFTQEAGSVIYFRPLIDAKPMGVRNFELSVLQWNTGIDETDNAWNDTFVHPDSVHWLIGGPQLQFPGLTLRAGITRKIDAAIYWTVRPGANYGLMGAQVQYNIVNDTVKNWAASARLGFNSIYGPDDMSFAVYGTDFLVSKKFAVTDWASVSPYAGASAYLSHAREKSDVVNLNDEKVFGGQGTVGAVAQISVMRLGVEYNFAKVNTFSYKLGVNLKF